MGTALKQADSFSLVKWYLDCVTDEGEVAIVYGTEISWHGIHSVDRRACRFRRSRRNANVDFLVGLRKTGNRIAIEVPEQGVRAGVWDADSAACERVVYETGAGKVKWNCMQPRSASAVRLDDPQSSSGMGYAECVTLTMAPSRLPLRVLRWGRFVSSRNWMVWVDWKGSHETSFAFVDGAECRFARDR